MRQNISREQLSAIADWIPKSDPARNGTYSRHGKAINLPAKLSSWNLKFKGPLDFSGGAFKFLGIGDDPCWFGGAHGAEACAAAQFTNGAVAAWCLHESCRRSRWQDLRQLYDGDGDRKRKNSGAVPIEEPSPDLDSTGKSTLEASAPFAIADFLLNERFTLNEVRALHHWQGSFWHWRGACFEQITDGEIRALIGNYLHKDVLLVTTKRNGTRESTNPTNWHTRNVFDALMSRANLPTNSITPPQWLGDSEGPKSQHLVSINNGLLDLETSELYPASPRFFNLNALDVSFRVGVDCPHWMGFLEQVWSHDSQSIDCLQEVVGYFLETSNRQQKIFLLIGPMRSGKGTVARVIELMLGRSVVKPSLTDFTNTFGLEQIIGRSLAIIPDGRLSRDANSASAVERMLAISGDDSPSIQRKYLPAYQGPTTCRFLILTNELPFLPDASGALASRIVPLRTFTSFLGREDTNLFEGKLKPEIDGIFRWALAGWQRLHRRGHFIVPDSAAGLLEDIIDLGNPLSDFINEKLVLDPENIITKSVVYESYTAWARRRGKRPMNGPWFFRHLGAIAGLDIAYRRDEFTGQARDTLGNTAPRRVKGLRLK